MSEDVTSEFHTPTHQNTLLGARTYVEPEPMYLWTIFYKDDTSVGILHTWVGIFT